MGGRRIQSEHEMLWVCTWLGSCPCVWEQKPIHSCSLGAARLQAEQFAPDGPCSILEKFSSRFLDKSRLQLGFMLTLVQSTRASAIVTDCAPHEVLQQLQAVESAKCSSVIAHCCTLYQCCVQLTQGIFILVQHASSYSLAKPHINLGHSAWSWVSTMPKQ